MNICFSGGAEGADQLWGILALNYGHDLIHLSFGNHKKKYDFIGGDHVHILSQDELNCADETLIKVNKILRRSFPTKSQYTNNLLRRNYFQINNTDSVYAVANLENGKVSGGTAWAVQMFIDRCENENIYKPLYILNQLDENWYKYNFLNNNWEIVNCLIPPNGKWTGIGSRNLTESSKYKMMDLFENNLHK